MAVAIERDEWWTMYDVLKRQGHTALANKLREIIEMGASGSLSAELRSSEADDDDLDVVADVLEEHQDCLEDLADDISAMFDVLKHHQSIIELHQGAAKDMNARLKELETWSEEADDAERIDANVADLEKRQIGLLSSIEGTDERARNLRGLVNAEQKLRQQLTKRVVAQSELIKTLTERVDAMEAARADGN